MAACCWKFTLIPYRASRSSGWLTVKENYRMKWEASLFQCFRYLQRVNWKHYLKIDPREYSRVVMKLAKQEAAAMKLGDIRTVPIAIASSGGTLQAAVRFIAVVKVSIAGPMAHWLLGPMILTIVPVAGKNKSLKRYIHEGDNRNRRQRHIASSTCVWNHVCVLRPCTNNCIAYSYYRHHVDPSDG